MLLQNLSRGGIKWLTSSALTLIGLGVLMLLFPLILAIVISSLFFLIALFCLQMAWKIHRAARNVQHHQQSYQQDHPQPRTHVEVNVIDVE